MRKNKRQLAAGMMASVMVLTTLAGCGASASSNNGKETNAAQTQGTTDNCSHRRARLRKQRVSLWRWNGWLDRLLQK